MLAGLVLLQIAVSAPDATPPRPISQLVHTRWVAEDGAPSDTRALAQIADGYLWLGTVSGLVRFDGVRFVPFVQRGGDSMQTVTVQSLLAARDGSLWVVWRNGVLSNVVDNRLINYDADDGLPAAYALTESSRGELVAGTATGLAHFSDGKWKDVTRDWEYPGTESRAVWFDRDDGLWAETRDRIVYRPAGGWEIGVTLGRSGAQRI